MAERVELSTSQIARELGTYEARIRLLDKMGVLSPRRDIFGRRIFSADDVRKGREHLARQSRG